MQANKTEDGKTTSENSLPENVGKFPEKLCGKNHFSKIPDVLQTVNILRIHSNLHFNAFLIIKFVLKAKIAKTIGFL